MRKLPIVTYYGFTAKNNTLFSFFSCIIWKYLPFYGVKCLFSNWIIIPQKNCYIKITRKHRYGTWQNAKYVGVGYIPKIIRVLVSLYKCNSDRYLCSTKNLHLRLIHGLYWRSASFDYHAHLICTWWNTQFLVMLKLALHSEKYWFLWK